MAIAAIDIGTNSVLLLVAQAQPVEPSGLKVLLQRATVTRLGQGVDASRTLHPEAVARTLACLVEYSQQVREIGVTRMRIVGTSAMRDAAGGEGLRAKIVELFGCPVEVIAGDEEASLTYLGARSGLVSHADDFVFDVGGGSTEFVQCDANGAFVLRKSLPIGCVRMTERYLHEDPPPAVALQALRDDVRTQLSTLPRPQLIHPPIAIAGTATTLAAVHYAVAPYDGAKIHGATLSRSELGAVCTRLSGMPAAARAAVPGLDPKRADVIVAGAAIIEEILDWLGAAGMLISDRGVRFGVIQALLAAQIE
jgi:exopolyphosphatase / guanosine-5'-triphosphate,3'-diphosphate pyrophosphatase